MAFVVVGRIRFGRCGALLWSKTALCDDSHGAVFAIIGLWAVLRGSRLNLALWPCGLGHHGATFLLCGICDGPYCRLFVVVVALK